MWFAVNSPSSIPWNPKKGIQIKWKIKSWESFEVLSAQIQTAVCTIHQNTSTSQCCRGDLWECKNWWSPEDFTSSSLMGVEVFPPFSAPLQHSLGISSQYQFVVKLSSSRLKSKCQWDIYIFGCKLFTHLYMNLYAQYVIILVEYIWIIFSNGKKFLWWFNSFS